MLLTKEEIIKLYCYKNLSDMEISKIYNCSNTTIIRFRKKHNIIKLYRDKIWLNEKYNNEENTVRKIAELINCSEDTVSLYLRKFGFSINHERGRIAGKKYNYNERTFETIDSEEKAYWLGFITADGCIEELSRKKKDNTIYNNYRLTFSLAAKDIDHLIKFKTFIGDSNIPINRYRTYLKTTNKEYDIVSLRIYCRQLGLDLINQNIVPQKSCKEQSPNIKNNLIRHFIRGELDGDGCLLLNDNKINIIGSLELMNFIKEKTSEYIKEECGYIYQDKKSINLYGYNIYKKEHCKMFLDWIYEDANIYLDRKYNIYINNINNNIYIDKRYSPTT